MEGNHGAIAARRETALPGIEPGRRTDVAPRTAAILAAAILLCGFGARAGLAYLSKVTVTHDEAFSMFESQFTKVRLLTFDSMPPLHSASLWVWNRLFGIGVLQDRLFSVVVSTLSLITLYLLASYLLNRRTAVLALLLLALSRESILFGRIIRPYAMLQFLVLLSAYCFARSVREKRLGWWVAFTVSAILTVYTHYYGALAVAALAVYAAVVRRRHRIPLPWIGWAALAGIVSYAPWLLSLTAGSSTDIRQYYRVNQSLPWYVQVHWRTIFDNLHSFNNGLSTAFWAYALGGLLITLPAVAALAVLFHGRHDEEKRTQEAVGLMASLMLIPLVVALGAGVLGVPYSLRYVLPCAAPYYVLAAYGILRLKSGALRAAVAGLIVASGAVADARVFDGRDAGHRVMAAMSPYLRPGDCGAFLWIVTNPPSWLALWDSNAAAPLLPLPRADLHSVSYRLIPESTLPAAFAPCSRIWVVDFTEHDLGSEASEIGKLDAEAVRVLSARGPKLELTLHSDLNVNLYSLQSK